MMMQLSMILGFFTAVPVNAWMIKRDRKDEMSPGHRSGRHANDVCEARRLLRLADG